MDEIKNILENINKFCNKIYDGFFSFFRKYLFIIVILFLFIFSLIIRISFLDYRSGDMNNYLLPWINHLSNNGGFLALKDYPNFSGSTCDYPLAYINILALFSYLPFNKMYIVKFISFFFEYLLAIGLFNVIKTITKNKFIAFFGLCIVLFLPTPILDSAIWGQCDQLYTCGIIWGLYFILKKHPNIAMIIISFALANKMHTFFVFPALIYLWLNKKITLRSFLFIPIVLFITFIPGYIFGVGFSEPLKIYFVQMGKYQNANYGAANIFALLEFPSMYEAINKGAGIFFSISIIGIVLFILYYKKIAPTKKNIIYVATLFAYITPYVLPHMHDRYFYFADMMILIYVLINKKKYYLVAISQIASSMCYTHFLTGEYIFQNLLGTESVKVASLMNLVIIFILLYDMKNLEKEENEKLLLQE